MLKNKKTIVLLAIILVIIVAGTIMLFVKGLNYGLLYGENTTIELYLRTDFNLSDVQNIIAEVFGNKVKIRQVNDLKYDILITTKSVQEDQLNNLISKINEKYSLELTTDDLLVTNNPKIKGTDIISPYILPVCITSIVILAYYLIRYKKLGLLKVSLITILSIVLVQLLMLSVYTITRIPVNLLTMPISMMLYLLTIIILTEKFEKDLQNIETK